MRWPQLRWVAYIFRCDYSSHSTSYLINKKKSYNTLISKPLLIVIFPYRFRDFDWQRFEFECLSEFVEIRIHELIEVLFPHFTVAYANQSELPNVTRFASIYGWYREFRKISKDAILFSYVKPTNLRTLIVCLLMRLSGAKIIGFSTGGVPYSSVPLNPDRRDYPEPIKQLFHFLRRNSLSFVMPEAIVVGGSEEVTRVRRDFTRSTKIVLANSSDYSNAVQLAVKDISLNKTAIYLDTGFPGFPRDEILEEITEQILAENWYPNLSKFFTQVEMRLDLKVVVAIHPKHVGRDHRSIFGNRATVGGQTSELVSSSELVIATNSTSISFAICYNKPLILVTSNLIESGNNRYKCSLIHNFADATGATIFNIDKEYSDQEICGALVIDYEKRESYKRKYLTSRIDRRPNYQILLDELINPHLEEVKRRKAKRIRS